MPPRDTIPPRAKRRDLEAALELLGPDDTAVLCVDLDVLRAQLTHLQTAFDPSAQHAIPVKTMPHPAVLAEILAHGFHLEAASMEEIDLARASGAHASQLVFDSPAKTRREIARCQTELPGLLLNANSLEELRRMPKDPSFRLGLRINPELTTDAPTSFKVADPGSRFGVPLTQRDEIIAACLDAPIVGLHLHIGSQVSDSTAHIEAIRRLVALADEIDDARQRAGIDERITLLDIGGGLRADEAPVTPAGTSAVMALATGLAVACPDLHRRQVVTEFGQWVHTHAGWAASAVEYVVEGPRPHAVMHLGADFLVRNAYSTPGNFTFTAHRPGDGVMGDDLARYDLDGPLCFAGDVVARAVALPRLAEGDWIIIEGVGANTFGLWSRHCSRHVPAVVLFEAGQPRLASTRRAVW